jgi:hypothetical protein
LSRKQNSTVYHPDISTVVDHWKRTMGLFGSKMYGNGVVDAGVRIHRLHVACHHLRTLWRSRGSIPYSL